MSDIETAIGNTIERHGKAAVMFSGGKESVVLAHLLEPFKDRIELILVNTGAHKGRVSDRHRISG